MRRREFITLLGGAAAAWPLAAHAQPTERVRRIGVLLPYADSDRLVHSRVQAFVHRLQDLGWEEGRNIHIDYRWAGDNPDSLRAYAAQLMALKPEVILAVNPPAAATLKQETSSVPVVFVNVADAVGAGLVENLAKPGGNLTGFTNFEFSTAGKWVDLLKQIAPSTARIAVTNNSTNPATAGYLGVIDLAATSSGLRLTKVPAHDPAEIEPSIESIARESYVGLVILPDPITTAYRDLIIGSVARNRLPTIYPFRYFATAGGLISYGPEAVEPYRQGASYVDRILKGDKPADLPVQGATKYELVINRKTAGSLGLEVPYTLLGTADEVIE
jgi:putative tryptophan/tyrosine transport system substrate-binding protein